MLAQKINGFLQGRRHGDLSREMVKVGGNHVFTPLIFLK
jgi:hypothetical protein